MSKAAIVDWFDAVEDEGMTHLFSGDLFEGVRGGGFLYTNRDTLSLRTVFHLDSLVVERAEPHELLNGPLAHPSFAQWLGDDCTKPEYSMRLVPDLKKVTLREPHLGRPFLVDDTVGQVQA